MEKDDFPENNKDPGFDPDSDSMDSQSGVPEEDFTDNPTEIPELKNSVETVSESNSDPPPDESSQSEEESINPLDQTIDSMDESSNLSDQPENSEDYSVLSTDTDGKDINSDPPPDTEESESLEDVPLANKSGKESFLSRMKKRLALTTIKQRFVATFVLLALVISGTAGYLAFAASGTTGFQQAPNLNISSGCAGEIVYYPFYMITPIKLFPYESKYSVKDSGNAQIGTQILRGVAASDDPDSILLTGKKSYTLAANQYYGNTIQGYRAGSLVMISNAFYTYINPDGKILAAAGMIANHKTSFVQKNANGVLGGNEDISNHIVAFKGNKVSTDVLIGEQDIEAKGAKNAHGKLQAHIFTNDLVKATGGVYNSDKFSEVFKNEATWKKLVKGKVKLSTSLWEAISVVEEKSSGLELDPMTKILKYLDPTEDVTLHNNYTKGTYYSGMNDSEKELLRYHELDLLLTLYTVAANNQYTDSTDSTCAQAWANTINAFIAGWSDPSENENANSLSSLTILDTLAISPVVGIISGDDYYLTPASDYVEVSLSIPDNVSLQNPETANSFSVNTSDVSNANDYILNLCNAALRKGNVKEILATSLDEGQLGSLNLLENVIGSGLSIKTNSNGVIQLKHKYNSYWNSFKQFKLTTKTWGSNLIFLDPVDSDTQKAIPQFAVTLSGTDADENDDNKSSATGGLISSNDTEETENNDSTIAGTLDSTAYIDENPKLKISLTADIGNNMDKWFKELKSSGDRKLRKTEKNKEELTRFMTNAETTNMYISYHIKRFVCVDDIEGTDDLSMGVKGTAKQIKQKNTKARIANKKGNGSKKTDSSEQFKIGNCTILVNDSGGDVLDKDKALKKLTDKVQKNAVQSAMNSLSHKCQKWQVADIWIKYELPDLADDAKTYRYGIIASGTAEKTSKQVNNVLQDVLKNVYGVYLNDNNTKQIDVIYKIQDAFIAYTNEKYKETNNDEDEILFQPYEQPNAFINKKGETKTPHAIRALGTGKAVCFTYKFEATPDIKLKPTITANVGGLLKQNSNGGGENTDNSGNGIENTDVKFGTKEGYVKETSKNIEDVPSITIGLDPDGSKSQWEELFNSKNYNGVYLILTVKRELTSEGTLPDNSGTVAWAFNYSGSPGFITSESVVGSRAFYKLETNKGTTYAWYRSFSSAYNLLSDGFTELTTGTKPSLKELRGESISLLAKNESPGNVQYATFSIQLDGSKDNKENFLSILESKAKSVGDTEETGLTVTTKSGKSETGNDFLTILDYSIAQLHAEGMTDVTATRSRDQKMIYPIDPSHWN